MIILTKPEQMDSKTHSTNYFNTFIEVAEDTKAICGTPPPPKGNQKTIAQLQYEYLISNPYQFTSDEIFFKLYAERNDLTQQEYDEARKEFFSKGQPCFRASPLTKTYGFGIHSDHEGKVAMVGMETEEYERLINDPSIKKVKAMRSSKKMKT